MSEQTTIERFPVTHLLLRAGGRLVHLKEAYGDSAFPNRVVTIAFITDPQTNKLYASASIFNANPSEMTFEPKELTPEILQQLREATTLGPARGPRTLADVRQTLENAQKILEREERKGKRYPEVWCVHTRRLNNEQAAHRVLNTPLVFDDPAASFCTVLRDERVRKHINPYVLDRIRVDLIRERIRIEGCFGEALDTLHAITTPEQLAGTLALQ